MELFEGLTICLLTIILMIIGRVGYNYVRELCQKRQNKATVTQVHA